MSCIEWPWGRASKGGYGQTPWGALAHRVVWEIANDRKIPPGMVVRHKCDNPPCVNPEHLEIGTAADNRADCIARNRHAKGERHGRAKLTWHDALTIRRLQGEVTIYRMAKDFGVTRKAIRKVLQGKTWRDAVEGAVAP
jgi:hypothetical protein